MIRQHPLSRRTPAPFLVILSLAWTGAHAASAQELAREVWTAGNGHEYVVMGFAAETWDSATVDMNAVLPGFHLATITAQQEQDFLLDLFSRNGISGQFWLGGVQDPITEPVADANWVWVTGEPWSYTNWRGGEPNDAGGPGVEQHLAQDGSFWNDEGSTISLITGYVAESAPAQAPTLPPVAMILLGALLLIAATYLLRARPSRSHLV